MARSAPAAKAYRQPYSSISAFGNTDVSRMLRAVAAMMPSSMVIMMLLPHRPRFFAGAISAR